jgi:predicted nucleic acid-binding Zn ribbon protein
MEKQCLECGEPIKGRIDKKFCSDLCRNSYNNRNNSDSNNTMRNINNILRRNRRILEELTPDGKSKVNREKLISKGFNFNYFTNIYQTKNGNQYFFCYEYGYLALEGDYFALVKRQEYVE